MKITSWSSSGEGGHWFEVPAPPAKHKHWAQTAGSTGGLLIERCPCGAFNHGSGWFLIDPPRVAPSRWARLVRKIKGALR